MSKWIALGMLLVLASFILACGSAAGPEPTAAPPAAAPTAAPTAIPTVAPTATEAAMEEDKSDGSAMMDVDPALKAAADRLAGGKGAIYVGDLSQLAGPAYDPEHGDDDGNVPLSALEKWSWIFESDYYQELLEKSKIADPTPLVTQGESLEFQMVCIVRFTPRCKVMEHLFAPNVAERTNGQMEISLVSYAELGIAGPDVMNLVGNGTLPLAEIATPYVAGELPALEVPWLWGLYPDFKSNFEVSTAVLPELNRLIIEQTGGAVPIAQFWAVPDESIFFFTKTPMRTLEDFKGQKFRSFGGAISDMIEGMGADGQFVAFSEVYVAMERGILDGGLTSTTGARGGRWYEVVDHMTGHFPIFTPLFMYMNKDQFDSLPPDFQQILLEEGAKFELEILRVAPILGEIGIPKAVETGLEYSEFSPELWDYIFNEVVLNRIVPKWVDRTGGPDSDAVALFNKEASPIVGVKINPDGSASLVE
ncbi:MAG: hypothetical protein F4X66_21065 [Chloroflexi bacterium]|nr:hypothetical protein [Chloroflexota bacterium]MYE38620.1 hypothetical protein [Chloroflexota bacterium]